MLIHRPHRQEPKEGRKHVAQLPYFVHFWRSQSRRLACLNRQKGRILIKDKMMERRAVMDLWKIIYHQINGKRIDK
jgi:hypothetical protein